MRRPIAVILLLAVLSAQTSCMTPPRPVASPRTYIPLRKPDRVWLTDKEGSRFQVMRPRAIGDTLFGRTPGGEEVWIAFRDLPRIEARELDRTKTYAVLGGSILAAVVFFALASSSGPAIPPDSFPGEMSVVLFRR